MKKQKIPKIIHQIWFGEKKVPDKFKKYHESWKFYNPSFKVKIWHKEEADKLLKKYGRYDLFYNKKYVKNFAERSDILRYLIVYDRGGIYADFDFECLKPFDIFLENACFLGKHLDLITASEFRLNMKTCSLINNALFGAVKGYPLFKKMIDAMENRVVEYEGGNSAMKLGPLFLKDFYNSYKQKEKIKVYEPEVFYPYNWEEKTRSKENFKETCPKAYAVHHWASSWLVKLPLSVFILNRLDCGFGLVGIFLKNNSPRVYNLLKNSKSSLGSEVGRFARKIEGKRDSQNLCWKCIVFLKDILWIVILPIRYVSLLLGFVYYFDPFLNKKINLRSKLNPKNRKKGISGFMRLRNEEEFVGKVIESVINSLDELVIVYNRCTDKTPKIVEKYRKKYPSKIRVYDYKPHVYPQGSKEHVIMAPDSVHSFVNYINFALVKTTYSVAVLIDGDDLFIPNLFNTAVEDIKKNELNRFLGFNGVNLWDENGKIYVNGNKPLMGGFDRGFFPVSPWTYYIKTPDFEHLFHTLRKRILGVLFFHMKGMKKDRGVGVYDLEDNPNSSYSEKVAMWYTKPKLIHWKRFKKEHPVAGDLPNPQTFGIRILNRR